MEKLDEILKPVGELLTDKQLKDKDLMVDPVAINPEKSYPIDQGDVTFSIGAQALVSAQLFNDEEDKDDEEFLSSKPSSYITFNPASEAYLKYQIGVLPKANGQGSIHDIGFELELSGAVKATYYKAHKNTEKIREAFLADATKFLTIFKWEDVQKLGVSDALSFNVGGKLSAGLKVSWSNIFSQSLSSLTSTLPQPLTLDVNLSPELTASFDVTITDEFSYFIKRTKADQLFVAVSKIKNSKTIGSLGASIGVAFSKPDEVEKQLNALTDELINAIVKKSGSSVEKAIDAVKNGGGTAVQKAVIDEVAELLGLTGVSDLITKLEERWKKLKDDLKVNIKKIAEVNIELSLTYQYERIKEGKELLSINIPDAALKKYHPKLLRFKLNDLLTDLGKESVAGAELVSYVNQNSLVIKKTWGLGLKIFGSTFLQGQDFNIKEENTRIDLKKHKQINQSRSVGYSWQWFGSSGKWLTEISASMKNFSMAPDPQLAEVDFAWYLNMIMQDRNVKKESELRAYFDLGVLWGAIQQHDVNALVEKYFPVLKKKKVLFESKLILSELATRTVIQQAGFHQFDKTNQELMARSLAAAMIYFEGSPIRMDVKAREEAYAPLWSYYLEHPHESPRSLANAAYNHLRKQPNVDSALLAREKDAGFNNQGIWFADVVYLNAPYNAIDLLVKGLADLSTKITANAPLSDNFLSAANKFNAVSSQSYYVKTLGSFFSRYASQNNMLKKEVQRIFTMTYEEDEKEQVINLSVI
jgi:hypothetical protein